MLPIDITKATTVEQIENAVLEGLKYKTIVQNPLAARLYLHKGGTKGRIRSRIVFSGKKEVSQIGPLRRHIFVYISVTEFYSKNGGQTVFTYEIVKY